MSQKLRVNTIDSFLPEGATQLAASSGSVANSPAIATLTPPSGKTAYLSQFTITASGATVGADVAVTVVGLLGGTQTYIYNFPAGALVGSVPLDVDLAIPIAATGPGVNIVVTLPAGGTGNTNAAVNASGYAV